MSNLIRRQDAIDLIEQFYAFESKSEQIALQIAMRDLPSAQPEIVQCKDCKHYEYGICKKAGLCVNKSPNGFCDWGER